MERTLGVVFGVCLFGWLLVGCSMGDPIEPIRKTWQDNEMLTLKSIKEMFSRPRFIGGLVRTRFSQSPVVKDPHCPAGFQRDLRGFCREVW